MSSGGGGGKKSPKFPELPPKYSVSREWRNKAEKLRRNRLNGYLNDAKHLVPMIANKTKKSEITRTNVLRAAASYIRIDQMYPSNSSADSPVQIQKANNHVEAMKGVVFLLSQTAKVLFIGQKTEEYVGYTQLDLMGMSLLDFTHPGDQAKLLRNLQRKLLAPGEAGGGGGGGGGHSGRFPSLQYKDDNQGGNSAVSQFSTKEENKKDDRRRSFYIRVREKPQSKNCRPKYEHMHVIGHIRDATESEMKLTKDLEYVFVGMMKTVKDKPIFHLNLMDAVRDQYITRHLPDGRIIFCDHRISTIAGYMPDEVRGHSAFNYMLGEDLPWTTLALRTMFASSTGEGLVIYRLKTANGGLITLQSRGFLELNKQDKSLEHFVCINHLLSDEEGEKHLEKQRERFLPMITDLHNYGINGSDRFTELDSDSQSRTSGSLKRKSGDTSQTGGSRQPKYRVMEHDQDNRNNIRSTPGTCIRLVSSSNGRKVVVSGSGGQLQDTDRITAADTLTARNRTAGGGHSGVSEQSKIAASRVNSLMAGNSSMAARNNSLMAGNSSLMANSSMAGNSIAAANGSSTRGYSTEDTGDSAEMVVKLLEELDSDDIVNTLRMSGVDPASLPDSPVIQSTTSNTATRTNITNSTTRTNSTSVRTGDSSSAGCSYSPVSTVAGTTSEIGFNRSIIVSQGQSAANHRQSTANQARMEEVSRPHHQTSRVIVSHTPVISKSGTPVDKQDFNRNFPPEQLSEGGGQLIDPRVSTNFNSGQLNLTSCHRTRTAVYSSSGDQVQNAVQNRSQIMEPSQNRIIRNTGEGMVTSAHISTITQTNQGTGQSSSAAGHIPSAAGHIPSATGHIPSAAGHIPSATGHIPSAAGHFQTNTRLTPGQESTLQHNFSYLRQGGGQEQPVQSGSSHQQLQVQSESDSSRQQLHFPVPDFSSLELDLMDDLTSSDRQEQQHVTNSSTSHNL